MALLDPGSLPPRVCTLTNDLLELARRTSRRYFAPGLDRDDLAQQAVLAVLQTLPCHDGRRHGPIEGYVVVAVRRALSRLCLREARRAMQPLVDVTGDGLSAEELAFRRQVWDLAARVLTRRQGQVLEMVREGWTVHEVAGILGRTPATVRRARWEAIRRLRKALAE
jgi:RNA polymerase sigma factor (sigma-70 family)